MPRWGPSPGAGWRICPCCDRPKAPDRPGDGLRHDGRSRCETAPTIDYRDVVSVWQIILVYVVTPGLIVTLLGVLTVGLGRHRTAVRYEPGQSWEHGDRLWAGVTPVVSVPVADRVGTQLGGAHAGW